MAKGTLANRIWILSFSLCFCLSLAQHGHAVEGPAAVGAQPVQQQDRKPPQAPKQPEKAQQPPQVQQPGMPVPADQQQRQAMSAPIRSPQMGLVTLNFDDADIYSVLQTIFGEVLRVNYIVDPRVKGRVTFRAVAPVPGENVLPLMEVILRMNGVGVVEDSGLYRIVPIADLPKEPSPVKFGRRPESVSLSGKAVLQVVPIYYVKSSDIVNMIAPFLSTNAVVVDVPKSNELIIVDSGASVRRLLQLIDIFDNEKLKQKRPEVYVYPVQNGKAKDISNLLQQIFLSGKLQAPEREAPKMPTAAPAAGVSSQPYAPPQPQISTVASGKEWVVSEATRIYPDEITNAIIILATPEDYAVIKTTIDRIDIIPRQVIMEGIVAQVTLTDNLSLGLSYLFKANLFNLDTSIGLNTSGLDPTKTKAAGFSLVGIDSVGSVRAMITALATQSKAKVLAAPHILVSDNREAKIQVGQSVPLITSETYGAVGVTPQRVYQYRDIGIILKVKSRVNEGGLVTVDLAQEISTFTTIPVGAAGETQIALNKTEAATNLVVQDGQTIVIGGLIREDTTKARNGIPWLSRIPLIGWLFGNTQDDQTRVELIVLLTPHVIKNQAEARDVTSEYVDKLTESSQGRIKKEELIKGKKEEPQKRKKE